MSLSKTRCVVGLLLVVLCGCGGGDGSTPDPLAEDDADTGSSETGNNDTQSGFDLGVNDQGGETLPDTCVDDTCAPTAICNDGIIEPGETCDDGNAVPGDGCSGVCMIEPGYTCPTPGMPCITTVTSVCGDGKIDGTENCDDGNTADGDGCSTGCQVEPGFACAVPGKPCTPVATSKCGDGTVNAGEQCDDGNVNPADGCDPTCKLEVGYTCPTPGMPCEKLEYCGDGIVQSAKEQCDDGNAVPGDGCSGVCKLEPGYACPTAGILCVKIWVCGNGKVDPGEACDDSNTVDSDGCSADCSLVEPGFTCPKALDGTGGPCTKAPSNVCGDGIVFGTEQCDDGNTTGSDGCSATCAVEAGYTCATPGKACTKIAFCGDSKVDLVLGEQCDDGNTTSADGCSTLCKLEPNFVCPTPGSPCVSTVKCGDGKVTGTEQCDDGNAVSSDGCSSTCQVEAGYTCGIPAAKCTAKTCGDGIKAGAEQCDDGNGANNDGCSSTCKLEPGFVCVEVGPKSVCKATKCGDNILEGFEQCDDGNLIPYDGCSPQCTLEPQCSGGTCTAVCGDGLKFPSEQCDDGNTISGDGCSKTCTLELGTGFTCTNVTQAPAASLTIPILYRDMLYNGTTVPGTGHPDFQNYCCGLVTGLAQPNLGPDGKPVFLSQKGSSGSTLLTSKASYCWWYHDKSTALSPDCGAVGTANPYDKLVYLDKAGKPTSLTLNQTAPGNGIYQFSSGTFFPIDGLGWGTAQQDNECGGGGPHNFAFTSELRYPFTYQGTGSEKFDFTGDDDVWVFINGKLAVDLGGVHGATSASVTLGKVTAPATQPVPNPFNLTVGGMYEIAMFQAERHTCASNYKLTLSGFVHVVTQCTTVCGDGKVAGDEVCDDGVNNGAYGTCMPGCKARAPYCGDVVVTTPPEQCDDGSNLTTYGGTSSNKCGPGCKFAPYCGDGALNGGEQCDEAALNGTGYGHCSGVCTLGPRCGDGITNGPEQCDDGVNNGSTGDKCTATCVLHCGNGAIDPGEACDNGSVANTGGYGKCNPNCTLGPSCGDGFKNGPEQCDDGKNDGSYGTCNPGCTLANYCGDGTLTNPPEKCDLGAANSSTAYGKALCNNRCTPAPFCGDKSVDTAFGETCDDGVNSGAPGSCTTDCKGFVPLATCGNGAVNPPEQCDDGASNGTAGSKCDVHCHFKCGNGTKDPGETCDNGVNDGSYGGCTTNCQIAGYCGDGIKNGPELCDNGGSNVSPVTAYGPGLCTTACAFAPFCGDGRVQPSFGEQCDGTSGCDATCKVIIPK